jgi:quercetin dioxygenase-like cupin family protein
VTLDHPGDYVVWSPGVSHRWRVVEDAVVVTVRWPSLPKDQSEHTNNGRRPPQRV